MSSNKNLCLSVSEKLIKLHKQNLVILPSIRSPIKQNLIYNYQKNLSASTTCIMSNSSHVKFVSPKMHFNLISYPYSAETIERQKGSANRAFQSGIRVKYGFQLELIGKPLPSAINVKKKNRNLLEDEHYVLSLQKKLGEVKSRYLNLNSSKIEIKTLSHKLIPLKNPLSSSSKTLKLPKIPSDKEKNIKNEIESIAITAWNSNDF